VCDNSKPCYRVWYDSRRDSADPWEWVEDALDSRRHSPESSRPYYLATDEMQYWFNGRCNEVLLPLPDWDAGEDGRRMNCAFSEWDKATLMALGRRDPIINYMVVDGRYVYWYEEDDNAERWVADALR